MTEPPPPRVAEASPAVVRSWRAASASVRRDARPPQRTGLDPRQRLYLRAYLWQRILIGTLGMLLPVILVLCDWWLLSGSFAARGSMSAYYFSGMRDVFVGVLFAIAVFLLTYKAFDKGFENVATVLAGLAAITVALFPTNGPHDVGGDFPPTPLQESLGEGTVARVHYGAAVALLVLLALLSALFGIKEGRRGEAGRRRRRFWRGFHIGCAVVIGLALVYALAAARWHVLEIPQSLLVGEGVAVFAFGLSWLWKGAERGMLGGPSPGPRGGPAGPGPATSTPGRRD